MCAVRFDVAEGSGVAALDCASDLVFLVGLDGSLDIKWVRHGFARVVIHLHYGDGIPSLREVTNCNVLCMRR
jgi:hypothetical protein